MLTADKRVSHGSINVFNAETKLSGFLFSRMNKSKPISPDGSIDLYIQSPSSDKISRYWCNIARLAYKFIYIEYMYFLFCSFRISGIEIEPGLYLIHQLCVFFSLVLLKESQWLCSCVSKDEKCNCIDHNTHLSNLTTVLDCEGTVQTQHNP